MDSTAVYRVRRARRMWTSAPHCAEQIWAVRTEPLASIFTDLTGNQLIMKLNSIRRMALTTNYSKVHGNAAVGRGFFFKRFKSAIRTAHAPQWPKSGFHPLTEWMASTSTPWPPINSSRPLIDAPTRRTMRRHTEVLAVSG